MPLTVFLILFVIILLVVRRWKRRKLINLYNQLKTKKPCLPLIGHAHHFLGSDEDQMKIYQYLGREAIENNGMSAFWFADHLAIIVADPVSIDFLLKTCLEKKFFSKFMRSVMGDGHLFARVPIWRPRRKIVAPTFSMKNLMQFMNIFVKQSLTMVQLLKAQASKGPFSAWPYVTTYTMDSVMETTMGVNINAQMNRSHPFLNAFEEGIQLVVARFAQPWLYYDVIYKMVPSGKRFTKLKMLIWDFIDKMIKSKRIEIKLKQNLAAEERDKDTKQSELKTFLELLIEGSGGERGYTDVELREESLVIVMAGTDTSAVATSFLMLMLARHQSVQQRVYEEMMEVFGDSKRLVQMEDLPRLKYLDAVIKETLRLYPPVPIIFRYVDRDVTLPSGVTLVKNSVVMVNIWATHRNSQYWGEDAEQFRPERFLDGELKHPAQFIPFSRGSRNCLGKQYAMMSAKVALSTILREFRILPAMESSSSNGQHCEASNPLRLKYNIMLKHVDNFKLKLESRV